MSLTINAPHLEHRLSQAAQEQRTTPAALAVQLLETLLPSAERAEVQISESLTSNEEHVPSATGHTTAERKTLFHRWLEASRASALPSLSADAFERASFYDDERHFGRSSL